MERKNIDWKFYNAIRALKKRGYRIDTHERRINIPSGKEMTLRELRHAIYLSQNGFIHQSEIPQ